MSQGRESRKLLAKDDFKYLKELWNKKCMLDVAIELKQWEKRKKTRIGSLLYEMWIQRFNKSSYPSQAFQFQSEVSKAFKQFGFTVRRTSIIDFLAIKRDIKFAVECKHSAKYQKIYEGISQLLYYRWRSGDKDSSLVLAISDGNRGHAELLAFAQSLEVDILVLERADSVHSKVNK